ncbi:hypothetical protein KY347_01455 [Candidatus Woesearchaeota archaeon]|nr:hypothetical protein [Candidatus Woesearchaeota archaeon]
MPVNYFIQAFLIGAFDRAYTIISKARPIEFLNMYNYARDSWGVAHKNREICWKLFAKFKK